MRGGVQGLPLFNFKHMEELENKIKSILINTLGVENEEISHDTRLKEDLGADSLDMVELCMEAEKQFNIMIPDDDFTEVSTFQDFVNVVNKNSQDWWQE